MTINELLSHEEQECKRLKATMLDTFMGRYIGNEGGDKNARAEYDSGYSACLCDVMANYGFYRRTIRGLILNMATGEKEE